MNDSADVPAAAHPLWRLAAIALCAGALGSLARSLLVAHGEQARRSGSKTRRPVAHDVGRWENEGGMVATKVPAAAPSAAQDGDGRATSGPA